MATTYRLNTAESAAQYLKDTGRIEAAATQLGVTEGDIAAWALPTWAPAHRAPTSEQATALIALAVEAQRTSHALVVRADENNARRQATDNARRRSGRCRECGSTLAHFDLVARVVPGLCFDCA